MHRKMVESAMQGRRASLPNNITEVDEFMQAIGVQDSEVS